MTIISLIHIHHFFILNKKIFSKLEILNEIEEKQNKVVNYDKSKNVIKINKYKLPGIKLDGQNNFEYNHSIITYLSQCFIYNIQLK